MQRPNLHVVERAAPPKPQPASPEGQLRTLFRREARAERQLLEIRQSIQAERKRYSDKHRLGCFPSIDHLRGLFK